MEPKDIKFKYNRNPFEKWDLLAQTKIEKARATCYAPLHSRDNLLVHIIKVPSTAQTTASLKRSSKNKIGKVIQPKIL